MLIIPYFGKFNNYFTFFLKSCGYNATINWLIITDDHTNYDYPPNVKVIYMTFAELRKKVQSRFDFSISLPHPYKLCDYKPAYGYIFADELKGYDFWGHCDNDLIFGDLRAFLTPDIFSRYDKILCKGHLSIFRNNDKMNSYFMAHTNDAYKLVYSTPFNVAFDEWGPVGILNVFNRNLSADLFWKSSCFDDPNAMLYRFSPVGKEMEAKTDIVYRFNRGKLLKLYTNKTSHNKAVNEEEILYVHLQKRPMQIGVDCADEYLIVPNKFIPYRGSISVKMLKALAGSGLIYKQAVKLKIKSVMNRIKINRFLSYKKLLVKFSELLMIKCDKLRILQTIGGFGTKSGGTSTCTYDLLSAVYGLNAGCKVDLLTPDVATANDKLMGKGEEWIKVVPNDYRTPLSISRNMTRFIEDSDYDVYHTNGMWMHINHTTCAIARSKNKPYVITPHGMLYPETLARSAWKKWPMRKIWFDKDIMNASCMHATCVDEMKHLRTFGYKGPVALIGNPVSVPGYTKGLIGDRSYKDGNSVTIGFLGRIHPRKHVERIIYGLSQSQRADVQVYVIGKGDESYEEFLKAECSRLGIESNVHFLGFLTGKEKFEQLARLDALLVPSDMENFGMIIPEALIVGTPVMASLGTPWEALNKIKCGWWCDNSPESIAGVINTIAESSAEELKKMGTRGREYVMNTFAAEEVARQMVDLYKWLNGEIEKPEFVILD